MSVTDDTIKDIPPNLQREWIPNKSSPVCETDGGFVILTYNILNKDYCPKGLYPYCPDDLMNSDRRHQLLMKEIDHHSDADIVCMQEVNSQYYDNVLLLDMQTRGFSGNYMKRNQPSERDTPVADGSATFYQVAKFQLVEKIGGHFKQLFEKEGEKRQLQDGRARPLPAMIDSSSVYLLTLLRCCKTQARVAVGNVHLTFRRYEKMNLTALEAAFAINELVRFIGGTETPHILCGDFNQEPHLPGYQLLHDGSLNETMATYLRNCNRHGNQQEAALVDVFPDCFQHQSASLKSAYETTLGHEVPFSNYEDLSSYFKKPKKDQPSQVVQALLEGTPDHPEVHKTDPEAYGSETFVAALDYVWFSSNLLHCRGVLKMVKEELIQPFHACPNAVFPSDHLPLKASFAFLKN